MRYRPTGDFTVSNTFSTNNFGEVGLAQGTKPLIQRTEVERPGPAGSSATEADNLARAVVLDDGASTNFLLSRQRRARATRVRRGCLLNGDLTPPYVSTTDPDPGRRPDDVHRGRDLHAGWLAQRARPTASSR